MAFDPYVYPGTSVLKNKFHVKSDSFLYKIERAFTIKRSEEFQKQSLPKKFDYDYFKSIHRYIFQDIYEWAGEQRTVDLAKNNHIFCRVNEIETSAEKIFAKLEKEKKFKGSSKNKLAEKLSELFFELNQLHPFREGNGRTQKQFLNSIAKFNNYELDFKNFTKEEMIDISIREDRQAFSEKLIQNFKPKSKTKEFNKNRKKELER